MRKMRAIAAVAVLAAPFYCSAQSGTISLFAGNGAIGTTTGDGGPAINASIGFPKGLAADKAGNVYIADTLGHVIRKVNASGTITTFAGGGSPTGALGDGGPAAASQISLVGSQTHAGIAVDTAGNVYIADAGHSRIRKVDTHGIITTVAGNGTYGFSGDGGPAISAQLASPYSVAVDAAGNLFICDTANGRIRKVDLTGTITTVAGSGQGFTLNDGGPATNAQLANPWDVAVDASGNIYIADSGNERVRKVTNGIITSILSLLFGRCNTTPVPAAGSDVGGVTGFAFDGAGNLYISDGSADCIHKLDTTGMVSTVAGGAVKTPVDGDPATGVGLGKLSAVAVDAAGNVYAADSSFGRVWKVTASSPTTGPPVITAAGITNAASFASGSLVPGSIATVFGTNLTNGAGINEGSSLPLATQLLNVAVNVNGTPAPVFAVDNVGGQQQINFQTPWQAAGSSTATVQVTNNGTAGNLVNVPVAAAQPGIFAYSSGGNTFGAILHANFQLADTGHPAAAGEVVLIYCTGLGAVASPPPSGSAAPAAAATTVQATVTIGGVPAVIDYSGLAPTFVGLYQVNAHVPAGLGAGNKAVIVSVGTAASNSVLLPVQ